MGEVYRAKDPRLGREVAIKVLPSSFSSDADRLRRFEQEARAAGVLNHPNLTAVYDIGSHDGVPYVVSELLEGETLDARLGSGPLPPRKAIEYALQLARGLAAAHEKGVVHRDLKPENVFVTRDGRVKILDFGLAKFLHPEREVGPPSRLPLTSAGTEPGVVLGTLGYMSPEQLRGGPADGRSDIFSFGAILFEMLSGKRAFQGATPADTISAILREDPAQLSETSRQIPDALERIVRHCLEKQPDERFRSAHDLAFALEAASGSSASSSGALALPFRPGFRRRRSTLAWIGALAAAALAGAALDHLVRLPAAPPPVRIRSLTYSGRDFSPAASPDGRTVAFVSERDGLRRIWLKQLAAGNEVALTAGPDDHPRFSPDGSMILFTRTEGQSTTLYRVPLLGGEPRRLVEDASDGDWSPDGGRIAFLRQSLEKGVRVSTVFVVAADGNAPREVARVREHALRWPRWSPDGRTIALVDSGLAGATRPIVLVDADGGPTREISALGRAVVAATWSGDGREIVYSAPIRGAGARLLRQDRRGGEPQTILWIPTDNGVLDILAPNTLIFESIATRQNLRELSIVRGTPSASRWLTRGSSADRQPAYSTDGEWVVFTSSRSGNLDIWAVSLKTGAVRRLTDDAEEDWDPVLTRDGKKLVWSSGRSGHLEIWIAEADGSHARPVTQDSLDAENPTVTPNGEWIVYNSGNPAKSGVWRIRSDGRDATRLVTGTTALPEISPDGQYVLYLVPTEGRQQSVRVARVADGAPVEFEIRIDIRRPGVIRIGRARWMPDGRSIAFVGQNENGEYGIFAQDFVPGRDTTPSRRPLGGFEKGIETESFGISPDGSRLVVAGLEMLFSVVEADGVPGLSPPTRRAQAR